MMKQVSSALAGYLECHRTGTRSAALTSSRDGAVIGCNDDCTGSYMHSQYVAGAAVT